MTKKCLSIILNNIWQPGCFNTQPKHKKVIELRKLCERCDQCHSHNWNRQSVHKYNHKCMHCIYLSSCAIMKLLKVAKVVTEYIFLAVAIASSYSERWSRYAVHLDEYMMRMWKLISGTYEINRISSRLSNAFQ